MIWTNKEIEYLKEHIGTYKITTIASNINRSYDSVVAKLHRLGLSSNTKMYTGLLTLGELSNILKVDRNTVKNWAENYGLPSIKRTTRRLKNFYFIDPTDFWLWSEKNKEKVQFSNIDPQILLPEPDWVDTERRKEKDSQILKKRSYKTWTTKEDIILVDLRHQGLSYKKIGELMERSPDSVAHRYKRLHNNNL